MGRTIGFIGVGNMGRPMAERLMAAGFDLVIHDANAAAVASLVEAGARSVDSAQALSDAVDTVFLSLPTPPIVEAVGRQLQGKALRRVIDLSTTGPQKSRELSAALGARGVRWLDSPVSGGVGGAVAGTLAVMFSGPREDFDDLQDMLKALGKPFYIGAEPGLAQTMKLVNNCLSAAAMTLSSEAVVMGVKAGIDARTVVEVINAGSGRNTATMQKFPQSILNGAFDYGFHTGLMQKDVALFVRTAEELGLDLPGCRSVLAAWDEALEKLGAGSDFTRIVTLTEERAGVQARG
ncbi:MAG: NAD(P)-dependent oxidoreductase [Proteobacteria bacterium]|nr:NAD(P)-dependent oxidoreductase [Pseudomonadota bacterium]